MKKTSLFLMGALTLGLAACSSDEPAVKTGSQASEGDLYTTLTLNFGTGTRSATNSDDETGTGTSTDGFEVGTLAENNIDEILVVLCSYDAATDKYTHVTHALANAVLKENTSWRTPTYVVRFETQDLYNRAGGVFEDQSTWKTPGETLYVFTYCNPTDAMKAVYNYDSKETSTGTFDQDAKFNITDGSLWKDDYFVMSNSGITAVQLPSKYDLLYAYNKETTPFNLGTVTVQRIATRFDLAQKDAETVEIEEDELVPPPPVYSTRAGAEGTVQKVTNKYELAANTYPIMDPVNNVVAGFVTMDAVSFFNEAKEYYGFMHTSADGTATDWKFLGYDRVNNYVVSPYYTTTSSLRGASNFNYSMVDGNGKLLAPESWNYTTYDKIIGGREDNVQWDNEYNRTGRDYYFWTYSTPNTIPGVENQIKGNTTGVLFRAFITPNTKNTELVAAMNAGNEIYAFEGKIYGDKDMLASYVVKHPDSEVERMFKNTFDYTTDADGNFQNVTLKTSDDTHLATTNGFTVYKATKVNGQNVYYCYYYYYNRHNDNGNDTVMGPMEFAAVRNNVYKLYVSTVKEFGHTGDPADDEKPEDPNDPDESPQTFFKVQVEVLPWVVRVNDINF